MPGVLIFKVTKSDNYSSLVVSNDDTYNKMKEYILVEKSYEILWEKSNVSFEQIEACRKTKDELVSRLGKGEKIEKVDLEKELSGYFN